MHRHPTSIFVTEVIGCVSPVNGDTLFQLELCRLRGAKLLLEQDIVTNASSSFPPRVLSCRSVTELMVAMGSSPQSRPNRSLSASLDGSVPTPSTSWQSSADGQSLADGPFDHTCNR